MRAIADLMDEPVTILDAAPAAAKPAEQVMAGDPG